MKIKFRTLLLITINLISISTCYADSYKAQGQFHFEQGQGGGKGIRSFKSTVVSGVPVEFKMGGNIVTMVFTIEPPPSYNYSLTLSLLTKTKSTDEFGSPFFTQIYQSTLVSGSNGPFEFEEQQGDMKFGGVIALNHRK